MADAGVDGSSPLRNRPAPRGAAEARIKAWLLATRSTLRDYLNLVVLLELLGDHAAVEVLRPLDALYPQPGSSVTVEVVDRLAAAAPVDLADVELASYKGLVSPWDRWP